MFHIDFEVTNRCNADCYFCPRDQTPHEGLMSPEVFDKAFERALEFRVVARENLGMEPEIALCGLGEPLLNRHLPEWIGRIREEGFFCRMASNGSILDERRANAILDAGVQHIALNVGETGEQYEEIYKLPWDRTLENMLRFRDLAKGRCDITIVLVNHREDRQALAEVRRFWNDNGFSNTQRADIINRGGALFIDDAEFEDLPEYHQAQEILADQHGGLCGAPFLFPFIGYDGLYYLCCSDWRKQVSHGSVFDRGIAELTMEKYRETADRLSLCRQCNLDPVNRLTEQLRDERLGETTPEQTEALLVELHRNSREVQSHVDCLEAGGVAGAVPPRRGPNIPLSAS
jgi:MoaA/NifB/PqqE/SkfB family radical SAM enzyme